MTLEKVEKFRRLVEQNPGNELARFSLGTSLVAVLQHEEAEKHFAAALESKPDWVMAYIYRARCLIHLGNHRLAREMLLRGREHSIAQRHDSPVQEIDALLLELPSSDD